MIGLSLTEIREIFQTWLKPAQADERCIQLWNALLGDLEMAIRAKSQRMRSQ